MHALFLAAAAALTLMAARAERLSPLADRPDWAALDAFQETIPRREFIAALDAVYAPGNAARGLIDIAPSAAQIVMRLGAPERFALRFAPENAARGEAPRRGQARGEAPRSGQARGEAPRFWRARAEIGRAPRERPLDGMRVALDPGHLGGDWARMEERWFQLRGGIPVKEGDLTLQVAEHLAPLLEKLGAEVLWVRRAPGPVTQRRPADFFPIARALLAAQGNPDPRVAYASFDDPLRGSTVQYQSELLFYRQAEIRERARIVNERLRPDLLLCLHFNAEAWGRPDAPDFVPRNHLHLLVNGCYSAGELRFDDNRFEMLLRLLGRITIEEQRVSTAVARHLARELALPPYIYTRDIAARVNESPYVWARNLLANRLYRCPVVFLEPYVMNSQEVWERVQAGDYEGERVVAGRLCRSIVREYAESLADALAAAMR
jgi:N-acetylmuramoyl-L-alanine amidase